MAAPAIQVPDRPLEQVLLLTYRSVNQHFRNALHAGRCLEEVREAMRASGCASEIDGASIFVPPPEYGAVIAALGVMGVHLGKHHVVVSEALKPLLDEELTVLHEEGGFKARQRCKPRLVPYFDENFAFGRTRRCGFDMIPLVRRTAVSVTASTTDARAPLTAICVAAAWEPLNPRAIEKNKKRVSELEERLSPPTARSAAACGSLEPRSTARGRAKHSETTSLPPEAVRDSVTELPRSAAEIRELLQIEGADAAGTKLRDTLSSAWQLVSDAPGPCLVAVIPQALKRDVKWTSVDDGYMCGRVGGRNLLRDPGLVGDLQDFVSKPDPAELGYTPDCWSTEHPDRKARGKPKDGAAAVLSFNGTVLITGSRLCHEPRRWHMSGGCRHNAALGLAEWLGDRGLGGVVFVRSESGAVRVLAASALARGGAVWVLRQ